MKKQLLPLIFVLFAVAGCEREFHPDSFDGDYGFEPTSNYSEKEIELGRSLFFDKILSGNKNISCATCHHPSVASADANSLSFGEGGEGVGKDRNSGQGESRAYHLLPRNSPALFNLGSSKITALFHDGRVEANQHFPNGVFSPEGKNLPHGLQNKLAVQAMFPVASVLEMAGFSDENKIGKSALKGRRSKVWIDISDRIKYQGRYIGQFGKVYGVSQASIRYVDIANAIGAFVDVNFRSINSPFDHYIKGDKDSLTIEQHKGMNLFYGKAKCATCHSGVFQTDNNYYSIGLPQVGPGKVGQLVRRESFSDFGRELVTKNPADRYKFRTPSLRNVELTAPYGHNGAYKTLEDIVEHHLNPSEKFKAYDCESSLIVPSYGQSKTKVLRSSDCWIMSRDKYKAPIIASHQLPKIDVTMEERSSIIEFLKSLTDSAVLDRKHEVPESVLSGLPVKD